MTGYTKLFGSIIASTIWGESDRTRIVWITMLAMMNRNFEVESSIPGLAQMARVTIPDCEKALKALESPDSYSRTKDFDGRRIQAVDGGWIILNGEKYRDKLSKDERREYLAKKQRERRERLKSASDVNNLSTSVTLCNTKSTMLSQAEEDTRSRKKKNTIQEESLPLPFPSSQFSEAWQEWVDFRKSIKKPLNSRMIKSQFKDFSEWGEASSLQSIRKSISSGYTGLHEPRTPIPSKPSQNFTSI